MTTTVSDYTALLSGAYWGSVSGSGLSAPGNPAFVTFSFPTTPPTHMDAVYRSSWAAFSDEDKSLARAALKQWADASGLVFLEVSSGEGDILFNWADFSVGSAAGFAGFAYYPYSYPANASAIPVASSDIGGDIFLDTIDRQDYLATADVRIGVLLHEIGHALGLKHPFEASYGNDHVLAAELDTQSQTVMSYTGSPAITIGPIDKAAIAAVYGGPTMDGTHVESWSWDAASEMLTLIGGAANDRVVGTSVRDIIHGGSGADALSGMAGNDTLHGGAGDDTLLGGAGDDVFNGGFGADILDGADGHDTADYAEKNAAINVALRGSTNVTVKIDGANEDTIRNIENINGGSAADTLTGDGFGNSFRGGAGQDTLVGGAGLDTADYSDKATAVTVFLNGASSSVVNVGGVNEDTIREIENVLGGSANDTLVGDGSANTLQGLNGPDLLFGASFAGDGSFLSYSGNDVLDGAEGDDGLWGADGDDVLRGGSGSDGLVGGLGNDSLDGGDGVDFLFGGDFSVVDGSFVPNSGNETLSGGNGNDGLWGFDGNDAINGDAGDDYAEGGLGNDLIAGGAGNDMLLGQAGADTIGGGTGFDYLFGGASADVFVFNKGDSFDNIWDFSAAEGDKIRLDPAFGVVTLADLQSHLSGFTFEGTAYTVISFADSIDQLTINGIAPGAFTLGLLDL